MRTFHRQLSTIDLSGIEYDPQSGEGVILVNWGTVLAGKLVVLFAGSLEARERLFIELASRL
jgi:hypothetical protein